jgi:glucose-6-phosphate 1-dehydrogenase
MLFISISIPTYLSLSLSHFLTPHPYPFPTSSPPSPTQKLLPSTVTIVGYARSALKREEFQDRIRKGLKGTDADKESFLSRCSYVSGNYGSLEDFQRLATRLEESEAKNGGPNANRLFYFAIPPSVFADTASSLSKATMSTTGWNRVVVEKPFGKDSASSAELSDILLSNFQEKQLFRIDHYLGKEIVQSMMTLRFGNGVFEPLWNSHHVQSVMITFKEPIGVEGRGGYFDEFGIIRDVMQNHLLQILTLTAMEQPVTLSAEDIRNEKVKVLRAMDPIKFENVVIGQYGPSPDGKQVGYVDDPSVPDDSTTPTFASAVMYIKNARWHDVPFILKCGKGLNERKAEVRIQFKQPPGSLLGDVPMNELVLKVQPSESVYMKLITKTPGLSESWDQTELNLTYANRFGSSHLPDAYERLILDVMRGDHRLFVRNDELAHAWDIFTPLLHKIENEKIKPVTYTFGSRGPKEADVMHEAVGFARYTGYEWSPQ